MASSLLLGPDGKASLFPIAQPDKAEVMDVAQSPASTTDQPLLVLPPPRESQHAPVSASKSAPPPAQASFPVPSAPAPLKSDQPSPPQQTGDDDDGGIIDWQSQSGNGHAVQTQVDHASSAVSTSFTVVPSHIPSPVGTAAIPSASAGLTVSSASSPTVAAVLSAVSGSTLSTVAGQEHQSIFTLGTAPTRTGDKPDYFITSVDKEGHTTIMLNPSPTATEADQRVNTGLGQNVAIIVGVSIGALVVLGMIATFISWVTRARRKQQRDEELDGMLAYGVEGQMMKTHRNVDDEDDPIESSLKRRTTVAPSSPYPPSGPSILRNLGDGPYPTTRSLPDSVSDAEIRLGPLQVANLMPGDISSFQSDSIRSSRSPYMSSPLGRSPRVGAEFGTPREPVPGMNPRFLAVQGRGLDLPWQMRQNTVPDTTAAAAPLPQAARQVPPMLRPQSLTSAQLGHYLPPNEGWRAPSRLPTPRIPSPPLPKVQTLPTAALPNDDPAVDGWAATLRSNLVNALSAVAGMTGSSSIGSAGVSAGNSQRSSNAMDTDADRFTSMPSRRTSRALRAIGGESRDVGRRQYSERDASLTSSDDDEPSQGSMVLEKGKRTRTTHLDPRQSRQGRFLKSRGIGATNMSPASSQYSSSSFDIAVPPRAASIQPLQFDHQRQGGLRGVDMRRFPQSKKPSTRPRAASAAINRSRSGSAAMSRSKSASLGRARSDGSEMLAGLSAIRAEMESRSQFTNEGATMSRRVGMMPLMNRTGLGIDSMPSR